MKNKRYRGTYVKAETKDTLRMVSLKVPERYLRVINELVELGYYPSRSELIRNCIEFFLEHKIHFHNFLEMFESVSLRELKNLKKKELEFKKDNKDLDIVKEEREMVKVRKLVSSERIGNTRVNEYENILVPKALKAKLEERSLES